MKRIRESLGYIGVTILLAAWAYYSVTNVWDVWTQVGLFLGTALVAVHLVLNFSQIKQAMTSRTGRYGGLAFGTLILVVGILVLANFLSYRHHQRWDLSEDQMNALSDQTVKIINNLEEDIRLVGFFTSEAEATRFQEMAQEYNFASSRVHFEIVDPQKEPSKVAQYQITRDSQVVVAGGARQEVIDDYSEEKLTNAIIKVTREEQKVVYFLTGHGERLLDDQDSEGYSIAREEIEKQNYGVETLNLAQAGQIPEDAALLISAGPQLSFFPHEVEVLSQYLEEGGKLFLMVDPDTDFDMDEFLTPYGIWLDDTTAVDASGIGQLLGLGPAVPIVAEYGTHPATRELEGLMSFFPRARSISEMESSAGYSTTLLLRTSARSWGETDLSGERVSFEEGEDKEGPLSLGIASSRDGKRPGTDETGIDAEEAQPTEGETGGTTETSQNQPEQDVVPDEPESGSGQPTEGTDASSGSDEEDGAADDEEAAEEELSESRLVVIGDSDFATNAYITPGRSANRDLFLNVVSWLAEDTDLISVRPREPTSRSLVLTAGQARTLFWLVVVLMPLTTLVIGLSIWYRHR